MRDKILPLFHRENYVLIGRVSGVLRCSLAEAERLLEELSHEKVIRVMTPREAAEFGIQFGYVLNK